MRVSSDPGKAFDCSNCDERTRKNANCRNWRGWQYTILTRDEWREGPTARPVLKSGDIKFLECPLSAITPQTWEILALLNEITNDAGQVVTMYEAGGYNDQPQWLKQAAKILQHERAEHRREEMKKRR